MQVSTRSSIIYSGSSAVDPPARRPSSRMKRGRNGIRCGGVELPIPRWVNIIAHRYKKVVGCNSV